MKEVLIPCNNSLYQHSEQYFLIYINRLTKQQLSRIVDGLRQYDWFTGFAEVDNHSFFKSYISNILVHSYIKMGSCVIGAHPSDYSDAENINMLGYPFEENGFSFISINEDSYGPFLSYKIETSFGNEEDVGFSFNALFPKFNSIQKISLKLDEDKWVKYLCNVERDKAEIIQKLGFGIEDKEAFVKTVYDKICSNYIYNLELNEHNILKFNVCIELPTISGNFRKTMISLKYFPEIGEISIITVT